MKKFRLFKSKNVRMFFVSGVIILAMTLVFFVINRENKNPNDYIAFSFMCLIPIVCPCVFYITKAKNPQAQIGNLNGLLFYSLLSISYNLLIYKYFALRVNIIINFVIVAVMFIFSWTLIYLING